MNVVDKMATPIQKLAQLSTKIFGTLSSEKLTKDHLAPLVRVMNTITSEDVHFDPKEFEERNAEQQTLGDIAPVTYMHIHQDCNFTMAVFVVKSGSVLPLHDHPRMHGLLKVIHGQANIVSYTEIESKPLPENVDKRLLTSGRKQRIKTVLRHNDVVLTDKDECCVLSPNVRNFHEIRPETNFAAFLDVLAPPYDTNCNCHYYKDVNLAQNMPGKTNSTSWLVEIPQPASYWCDTIKYRGPVLT